MVKVCFSCLELLDQPIHDCSCRRTIFSCVGENTFKLRLFCKRMVIFEGDVWNSFVDKQYFYTLLFQTARKAVLVLVAPAVLPLKVLKQEYWLHFFFFHSNPKITFGEGGYGICFLFWIFRWNWNRLVCINFVFCSGLPWGSSEKLEACFRLHLEYAVSSRKAF